MPGATYLAFTGCSDPSKHGCELDGDRVPPQQKLAKAVREPVLLAHQSIHPLAAMHAPDEDRSVLLLGSI